MRLVPSSLCPCGLENQPGEHILQRCPATTRRGRPIAQWRPPSPCRPSSRAAPQQKLERTQLNSSCRLDCFLSDQLPRRNQVSLAQADERLWGPCCPWIWLQQTSQVNFPSRAATYSFTAEKLGWQRPQFLPKPWTRNEPGPTAWQANMPTIRSLAPL